MQGRILIPGEVGASIEPRLTWEGLRNFLGDMCRRGERMPIAILVSEYDRRNLNQEILGASSTEVSKEDQRPEHDGAAMGFIEGVMVSSHPDVARSKARLVYPPVREDDKPLPSGKIISIGPIVKPAVAIITSP